MYRVLKSFELFEPATVEETVRLLFIYGARAKVLAGGLDLVMKMRLRLLLPEYVISIQHIPGLDYVEGDSGTGLRIGALATMRAVEISTAVQNGYRVLYEGISAITSMQVKAMGTAVGNLCVATPATDLGPPLFVLGAKLRVAGTAPEKVIPIEEFFVAPEKSVLEPHEMVTEILVPAVPQGAGGAFLQVAKTKADIPKVNAAVMVTLTDNRCSDVRIALGSVAPTVIRAPRAEKILRGKQLDEKTIDRAAEAAAEEAKPITDVRSTAEYRRTMVKVLVRDALEKAIARAKA
jgi:carbon-monoxide dehydrogenase medium subunit